MTSFQEFKLREQRISPTFSYVLINNALLYHFLANWLAHNKKMTEKSVFHEAWSPELASQSFPVSCFWCRGFVHHRKWNLTLLAHQNTGKENRYRKIFLLHLSAHWGDLIEQIKKICHIHFQVGWPNGEKLLRRLAYNFDLDQNERKSTQLNASSGRKKSQVAPSFQLASTCDSVWPRLKKADPFPALKLTSGCNSIAISVVLLFLLERDILL